MAVTIREEIPEDIPAIYEINKRVFQRDAEALLVNKLREGDHLVLSLVAVNRHEVVGHIAFSPVSIGEGFSAVGLAPMAVMPEYQTQGVGTMLINKSMLMLKKMGISAVFVLGHPDYYPRFGFKPASGWNIKSTYDVAENAFMVRELVPQALKNISGTLTYGSEFAGI